MEKTTKGNSVSTAVEPTLNSRRQSNVADAPDDDLLQSLKTVKEDIGQICEMLLEEENLVTLFFESLAKLASLFPSTIPVSPHALLENVAEVARADLDLRGCLILRYHDGRLELKDLKNEINRDLLMRTVEDIVPKFKRLAKDYRMNVEYRIKLLSSVTKELQTLADEYSRISS